MILRLRWRFFYLEYNKQDHRSGPGCLIRQRISGGYASWLNDYRNQFAIVEKILLKKPLLVEEIALPTRALLSEPVLVEFEPTVSDVEAPPEAPPETEVPFTLVTVFGVTPAPTVFSVLGV